MTKTNPVSPLTRMGEEPFMVYICADSTLTYGPRGHRAAKIIPVAIPVCSVATQEEAEYLIMLAGKSPYTHMFEDGDKAYHDRAAKVKPKGGGPAQRKHYGLGDFQFDNVDTIPNVLTSLCDLRDAIRSGDRDAVQAAMLAPRTRIGNNFSDAKAAEHEAVQRETLAKYEARHAG